MSAAESQVTRSLRRDVRNPLPEGRELNRLVDEQVAYEREVFP